MREQHSLAVRRQRDLRGQFYVSLRPHRYQRRELLHYLSLVAGAPCEAFRIVEESVLPQAFGLVGRASYLAAMIPRTAARVTFVRQRAISAQVPPHTRSVPAKARLAVERRRPLTSPCTGRSGQRSRKASIAWCNATFGPRAQIRRSATITLTGGHPAPAIASCGAPALEPRDASLFLGCVFVGFANLG